MDALPLRGTLPAGPPTVDTTATESDIAYPTDTGLRGTPLLQALLQCEGQDVAGFRSTAKVGGTKSCNNCAQVW